MVAECEPEPGGGDTELAAAEEQGNAGYQHYHSKVLLFVQQWLPPHNTPTSSILYLVHGLHGHCTLFHDLATYMAARGIACYSHDNYGHGRSQGVKVQPPTFDVYVEDVIARISEVKARHPPHIPLFLFGHSLGGLIALNVTMRLSEQLTGSVFMSPAFGKNNSSSKLSFMEPLAAPISRIIPDFPVPTNLNVRNFTSVRRRQEESEHDPLLYHGSIKLRHTVLILDAISKVPAQAKLVALPYLLMAGSQDVVTPIPPMDLFHDTAPSSDKTFIKYEGMKHCLYIETDEVREKCFKDLAQWICQRVK
jgi:acylglycerol lipase